MMKIKVLNEENPLESVIELGGQSVEFTPMQLLEHRDLTEKTMKQAKGQLEINAKQDELALEILPELTNLQDKWQLVKAYAERQMQKPEFEKLIEVSEGVIEEYENRIEDIKALGIKFETIEVQPAKTESAE
jgi:hypothetical protein